MTLDEARKLTPVELLVYWIKERESMRLKKEAGLPRPWTDDEILDTYRFCNVRRMDDKVSRWLMDNWYRPNFDHPNMLYAVAVARFINLPRSLVGLSAFLFEDKINWKRVKTHLRSAKSNGPIFNAAYMVRGNDGVDKVASVIDYNLKYLVKSKTEVDPSSMENTHGYISRVYGFGSFMAGQVVADLRWAVSGAWRDRMTWAPKGPGSTRGLNRLRGYGANQPMTDVEFRDRFAWILEDLPQRLPTSITSRLEAMDYQNCLCEFDKYSRVLNGEGRPKQIYRGVAS